MRKIAGLFKNFRGRGAVVEGRRISPYCIENPERRGGRRAASVHSLAKSFSRLWLHLALHSGTSRKLENHQFRSASSQPCQQQQLSHHDACWGRGPRNCRRKVLFVGLTRVPRHVSSASFEEAQQVSMSKITAFPTPNRRFRTSVLVRLGLVVTLPHLVGKRSCEAFGQGVLLEEVILLLMSCQSQTFRALARITWLKPTRHAA